MAQPAITIGDTEIVALADAVPAPVSPDWSFPDVPLDEWPNVRDGSLNSEGMFEPNLGCFLVRRGGQSILVDAGIGPGPNAYLKGIEGHLPERLAEADSDFAAIDAVVFTHLHMDHVGWAALAGEASAPVPTMPQAKHFVAARELAYWSDGGAGAGKHHRLAYQNCIAPLVDAGLIAPIEDAEEFLSGISLQPFPGHTPGHAAVLIDCGDAHIAVIGDLMHCPAQAAHPQWSHRADHDRDAAESSRRLLLERAAEGGWIVAAGHFRNDVVFGRIEVLAGGRYRHVAMNVGGPA